MTAFGFDAIFNDLIALYISYQINNARKYQQILLSLQSLFGTAAAATTKVFLKKEKDLLVLLSFFRIDASYRIVGYSSKSQSQRSICRMIFKANLDETSCWFLQILYAFLGDFLFGNPKLQLNKNGVLKTWLFCDNAKSLT